MPKGNAITFGVTGDSNISIPDKFSRAEYRQPKTDNYLLNTAFKFSLARTPNLTWFCQKVSIPSLSFGSVEQPTRFGTRLPMSGSEYTFDDLVIDFIVDENVNTWMEIYDWMTSLGQPKDDKDPYLKDRPQHTSDAVLTILSSSYNAKYKIVFRDLFPIALGELPFDSTAPETDPIVSTATFKYRYYEIQSDY